VGLIGEIDLKSVVVYGRPNCPYCDKATEYLKENNIKYKYIDIIEDFKAKEFLILNGKNTVPQIYVDGVYHGESESVDTIYDNNTVRTVIKSDGTEVPFDPVKMNIKAKWAAKRKVNWSKLALNAMKKLQDRCTTKDIDKALISSCIEEFDEQSFSLAGRLLAGVIYKEAYGGLRKVPSLKQHHDRMVFQGYWEALPYSDEEFSELESVIDHGKDLGYSYSEIKQINDKYVLRNRVKDVALESPQMMYMGMAMANMKEQPKERRIEDVVKLYTYLSDKKICSPTPFNTKLRTPSKEYASCAVFTTHDTAESLAAGDHIAYMMTCASAGIGAHLKTRSKGDGVRGETVVHQGKRPYFKMTEAAVAANLQAGRGGSATMHVNVLDPEIEEITLYKSKKTASKLRVDGIHYSIGYNKLFAQKVIDNDYWLLVSYKDSPELYEAMYEGDQTKFNTLYEDFARNNPNHKKVNAKKLAMDILIQGQESGQVYLHRTDEINRHTPFKEKIYSSNLCVAPNTLVLTRQGNIPIVELEDKTVDIWNGEEWSEVVVRQTGVASPLIKVSVSKSIVGSCGELLEKSVIEVTPDHKWYDKGGNELRTFQLHEGLRLESWQRPEGGVVCSTVTSLDEAERQDTYCFSEPKRHRGVFNGVLTGQCQEIALPTKGYESVIDLYKEGEGEIGLCSLAAIVAGNVSEEEWEDVTYYAALMIDNVIEIMNYPFPNLAYTAKNRRSLGMGITNLAGDMAKRNLKYSSKEGKQYIHSLSELHMYSAIKASLRLAKERGVCGWIGKTKWVDGWLPIDTMNTKLDEKLGLELEQDWETLRAEIKEVGGLRNSVLVAHMPNESSSIATNGTNSILPARSVKTIKTNGSKKTRFLVPNSDSIAGQYELAWDIKTRDLMDVYSIVQKFTDQAISADIYIDFTKGTIQGKDLLVDLLYMTSVGMKTRYYVNSKTNSGQVSDSIKVEEVEDKGCAGGGCAL
jgi:ribonucleoside-diphosphate reductase alpha chain